MSKDQVHAGRRLGSRAVRPLISLAAALAAACCASACGAASTASSTPASSSPPSSSGAPSGQAGGAAAAGRSTPGAVLADWIHQVAAGDRSAACQDMRQPGLSAQRSAATCMSAKGTATLAGLHSNFVTDGIKPTTPVSVTGAHVTGPSATISGSDVHVSGTTLDLLMVAHSTGVKPGQLTIAFDLAHIDGAWYVTDMNMNV